MLDSVQDQYDSVQDSASKAYGQVADRTRSLTDSSPDGTNVGISQAETAVALIAAMGAGAVAQALLKKSWRAVANEEPPKNPAAHDVAWREALLWGALSGAVVGM